jgi:hypothetical protein
VVAVAAVGARGDDAFFFGKACQQNVEEAAEGQTEEGGEERSYELERVLNIGVRG